MVDSRLFPICCSRQNQNNTTINRLINPLTDSAVGCYLHCALLCHLTPPRKEHFGNECIISRERAVDCCGVSIINTHPSLRSVR